MADGEEFPLVDIIESLSDQLRVAVDRASMSDKARLLSLKGCTVELALTWEKKGSGGVDFKVVKLGGGITRTNVQTITLQLSAAEDLWMPA
jgi:hypothetical protein